MERGHASGGPAHWEGADGGRGTPVLGGREQVPSAAARTNSELRCFAAVGAHPRSQPCLMRRLRPPNKPCCPLSLCRADLDPPEVVRRVQELCQKLMVGWEEWGP